MTETSHQLDILFISPDMHRLVFARHAGPNAGDLYLLTLSRDLRPQGEPKRLTSYNRLTSSPVWTPDGRAIVFARAEQAGMHALWRMRDANPSKIEPPDSTGPCQLPLSRTTFLRATGLNARKQAERKESRVFTQLFSRSAYGR